MAEGQLLFTLDYDQFNEIRQQDNLFKLREEFETRNFSLSRSLIIAQANSIGRWSLIDFENQKIYYIRRENDNSVEISEGADIGRRTDILNDADSILPLLQEGIGTHTGIIDSLKRVNFNADNLENLKRSDLSVRKLGFESVYPDLEVTYKMLYEILAAPRTALISLSSRDVQQLKKYILQSYEMTRKIVDFGAGGRDENIRKQHANLSQEIHKFCENVKQSLLQTAAYLSSKRVEQLENQVETTLASSLSTLSLKVNLLTFR